MKTIPTVNPAKLTPAQREVVAQALRTFTNNGPRPMASSLRGWSLAWALKCVERALRIKGGPTLRQQSSLRAARTVLKRLASAAVKK